MLPDEAMPLRAALAPHLTRPTARRSTLPLAAAILARGRHTVADPLRTRGPLAPGHGTDYRRAPSRAPRSGPHLGRAPAGSPLAHLVPDGPVAPVGDDTGAGHPGKHAYGKARHRDPVRPSHALTAWRYGHRRAVPAIVVRSPSAARPRASPILVDLYRSEADDRERGRPHRTPARLMCRLLRLPPIRFPGRRSASVGDPAYGAHEVAHFVHRHRRLDLVSELGP